MTKPNYETPYKRGNTLLEMKQPIQVLDSFNQALLIKPDSAEALCGRGNALLSLNSPIEALASYDCAIRNNPGYAKAFYGRGNALLRLKCPELAVKNYDMALIVKPNYVEALYNRGNALFLMNRFEQALDSYSRALMTKPDYPFLYGAWLHTKMKICDWIDIESQFAQLIKKIEQGEKASTPLPVFALSNSPALQRKAAEIYVRANYPISHALPKIPKYLKHDKIRIGYFSSDFHDHPFCHLMAGMFEEHDKSRFELTAFSFGLNKKDAYRQRLAAAFDRFVDVRNLSDTDVAMLSRSLEIDIAIDRKGFTQNERTGIFALRAAPIQVGYLAYPGTMGVEYIDYIIADTTTIPKAHQRHYSEKIAYLPNSYQANDAKRFIADIEFTKAELHLPQTGFIFCCFNNNYKITPGVFDSWMRILKHVEGSVLWLFEDNAKAATNLKKEAAFRGVNAERLVFAKRIPVHEHLARHRVADLFLDTFPYNAHTTASDALWAGLPVLTCAGETFASRVAASLLNAIRLPELITSTVDSFEAVAVELANNLDKLKKIKQKLANHRLTTPLFDTSLFTRHIEAVYTKMYERYQAGLAPDYIYVSALV